MRTFLFHLLSFALGPEHAVGSDQFVYWDASNPRRCLSPDVYVRLDCPQPTNIGSWQAWRLGAPELAIEIISPNEGDGIEWEEKLARYHQLGVRELVRFDPESPEGQRLRVWDRVEGDLVEREVTGDTTPCLTLGLAWTVRPIAAPRGGGQFPCLRPLDGDGRLLESREEAEIRARTEAEGSARKEADARARAEARVGELEEELRRARAENDRKR